MSTRKIGNYRKGNFRPKSSGRAEYNRNGIPFGAIRTGVATPEYRSEWDRIFGGNNGDN